ncbi:MAG: BREX-1 system adenine-specific DNA-methyltransferase PglX [Candidatus Viridilinea halotolerans]|uniref:site-specific DNA-methyltransferase (adenine-specific) n=1 Tax=Candidatus Viridilinea halotolerans TaxID=2491704 RepID=A0A426U2U6_9CHLR|nr:MAG: BREX-1 system adenine-specific DNA-methyltransferase PglX [Candidatus Viridilinea halotolerans]
MIDQHKKILAAVMRDLRRELLGTTEKDGTEVRGDLDRELERLGVLRDGRIQPLDVLPNATTLDAQAHEAASRFIETRERQGRSAAQARVEFVEEAAYLWINRLVALRALEARRLVKESTLRPEQDYGGVSEAIYLLAQEKPTLVASADGGWWYVLEQACARQAAALPGFFSANEPGALLRPSIPALRRAVALIGPGPAFATPEATNAAFADPDAIGWAYQFYQEEAKAAAFASFKAGKKAVSRSTIAAATQLFTEPYMVKWLLQNSLGRSYHEIYPESALPTQWEYYVRLVTDNTDNTDKANEKMSDIRAISAIRGPMQSLEDLTILDPCVGSGHFLREAFDMLVAMYRERHPDWDMRQVVETILRRHLHGIDIDPRAVQLAALTLYMRGLELLHDEARMRRRSRPSDWTPPQINLATTPVGLDETALKRHIERHPEDRPLRPLLERIFASLSQAELLGSLLRPDAEIDSAIAKLQAPRQTSIFDTPDPAGQAAIDRDPTALKQMLFEQVATSFREEATSPEPASALFGREAERGVRLLQLLGRKYALVVTNPPYMGSKNMPDSLKRYVEQHYKPGKRDLYAAFILRCLELCLTHGRVAMVTQQSWMFLRSFADLRAVPTERLVETRKRGAFTGLLRETAVEGLAHLGPNAFEEISGEVVQAALFTLTNTTPSAAHRFSAFRLIGLKSAHEKERVLRTAADAVASMPLQNDLLAIPETPMVYWLRPKFFELLQGYMLGDVARVVQGITTADDQRFVRFLWEVKPDTIGKSWMSYEKGGGYAKWFGHQYWVVNWVNYGSLIKSSPTSVIRNEQYHFTNGWSYSYMSRGSLGLRRLEGEGIFSHQASAVIPSLDGTAALLNGRFASSIIRSISARIQLTESYVSRIPFPQTILAILAKLEQSCVHLKRHLIATDPTERSFSGVVADQGRLDAIAAVLHTLEALNEHEVFAAYDLADEDIAAVLAETGTPAGFFSLLEGYTALPELDLLTTDKANENMSAIRAICAIRGLKTTDSTDTTDSADENMSAIRAICAIRGPKEIAHIKARLRALYEAGPGAATDTTDTTDSEDEEEVAVVGAHIPIPTETFLEELSVKMELHPISVYWLLEELRAEGARCKPEERRTLEDRLSVLVLRMLGHRWPAELATNTTDSADNTNKNMSDIRAIRGIRGPDSESIATRLRKLLYEEDGPVGAQRTEALLAELTGAASLEEWCARFFWPRHVKQFKARPVAWHLASRPAGAGKKRGSRVAPLFECMLYYHATSGDSLALLRTQYIEPVLRREEAALSAALAKDNSTAAAVANARVGELRDFIGRIEQVEREGFACAELDALLANEPLDRWSGDGVIAPTSTAELARQERAWLVDRNDGVRVNIAPLQLAGILAGEVLKAADAKKALADRARWRADERRWVREGKLPRCGWMAESIPESPAWTERAPERAAEQRKLEAKRQAAGILPKPIADS